MTEKKSIKKKLKIRKRELEVLEVVDKTIRDISIKLLGIVDASLIRAIIDSCFVKNYNYLKGKQDIHEADLDFQRRVRDNYILSMEGAINCKIIPCAEISGDFGGQHWYVLKPQDLFESYKKYLDFVLLNKELC